MKENTEDYYSISTVAQVLRTFFATYILKKWWLLLLVLVAGVISSLVYYHNQKPKYMAVCTFILEEKSASGGAMAGLASQFGFNLASLGSGGSIFAGDNILEILKSKKVVQKVLLSQIDSSAGSD
ncbi:MAG TPA: hypothetical protein VEZ55_05975, partial [Chitinophagaceae bacterium]|nr:hypothetical protein [Chitinophagaceae bacterium]